MAERNREPSQRQLRVGQEIKRILAGLIQRGEIRNLEVLDTIVTITEVDVSPDMKYANVYIMTLNDINLKEALAALQLAANYLRKQVSSKLTLRSTPEFTFKIDESFDEVDKIERLLRDPKVAKDLQEEVE